MAEIISYLKLKTKNEFDIGAEPCSKCNDQPECKNTCDKASAWWGEFANRFSERSFGT